MFMQYIEYYEAQFSLSDGIYGSTFFLTTGFHGFHVTVGAIFLLYTFILILKSYILPLHHFRFEAAA
jgi:heme/copper-type cytochrome/quinol oxidase subunit 3